MNIQDRVTLKTPPVALARQLQKVSTVCQRAPKLKKLEIEIREDPKPVVKSPQLTSEIQAVLLLWSLFSGSI